MEAAGWIRDENVQAFGELLALIVGYRFDESDALALDEGVRLSDEEAGRWFAYTFEPSQDLRPGVQPLHGAVSVEADFALAVGSSTAMVKLTSESESERLAGQLDMLIAVGNCYRLESG